MKIIFKTIIVKVFMILLGMLIAMTIMYVYSLSYESNAVHYNSTGTNLTSTTVQGALDELNNRISNIKNSVIINANYAYGIPTVDSPTDYTALNHSIFLVRIGSGRYTYTDYETMPHETYTYDLGPVGICLINKDNQLGCFPRIGKMDTSSIGEFLGVTCNAHVCSDIVTGISCYDEYENNIYYHTRCQNDKTGEVCTLGGYADIDRYIYGNQQENIYYSLSYNGNCFKM